MFSMDALMNFDQGILPVVNMPTKPKRKFQKLTLKNMNELKKYYRAYEAVKRQDNSHFEKALREIRLKNLFQRIRIIVSTATKKRKARKRLEERTSDEIYQERIRYSRVLGNEYNRENKMRLAFESFYHPTLTYEGDDDRTRRIAYGRAYGNRVSMENRSPLAEFPSRFSSNTNCSILGYQNDFDSYVLSHKMKSYGMYYSLRNRLKMKDEIGDFDDEYHELLVKSVEFEKEHLDVFGFLEEKIRSNTSWLQMLFEPTFYEPFVSVTYDGSRVSASKPLAICDSSLSERVIRAQNLEEESIEMAEKASGTAAEEGLGEEDDGVNEWYDNEVEEVVVSITTISLMPDDVFDSDPEDLSDDDQQSSESELISSSSETIQTVSDLKGRYEKMPTASTYSLAPTTSTGRRRDIGLQESVTDLIQGWRQSGRKQRLDDLLIDLYLLMFKSIFHTAVQTRIIDKPIEDLEQMKNAVVEQTSVLSAALKDVFKEQ